MNEEIGCCENVKKTLICGKCDKIIKYNFCFNCLKIKIKEWFNDWDNLIMIVIVIATVSIISAFISLGISYYCELNEPLNTTLVFRCATASKEEVDKERFCSYFR